MVEVHRKLGAAVSVWVRRRSAAFTLRAGEFRDLASVAEDLLHSGGRVLFRPIKRTADRPGCVWGPMPFWQWIVSAKRSAGHLLARG